MQFVLSFLFILSTWFFKKKRKTKLSKAESSKFLRNCQWNIKKILSFLFRKINILLLFIFNRKQDKKASEIQGDVTEDKIQYTKRKWENVFEEKRKERKQNSRRQKLTVDVALNYSLSRRQEAGREFHIQELRKKELWV